MNTRKALVAATIVASAWGLSTSAAGAQSSAPTDLVDTVIGTVNAVTGSLPVDVPQLPSVGVPTGPLPSVAVPAVPGVPALPAVPGVPALPALPTPAMPATPALPALPDAPAINAVLGTNGISITLDLTSLGFGVRTIGVPPQVDGLMASTPDVITFPETDMVEQVIAEATHTVSMLVADIVLMVQDLIDGLNG